MSQIRKVMRDSMNNFLAAPDQQQRDAALDIGQSCIVEAPAGSGKTGLLVQRFLKLLAYGDVDYPEQVLAITFARDATAEIRNRISVALEQAARSAPLKNPGDPHEQLTRQLASAVLVRNQKLQWRLLEQPQRLNVRSIDAVCAEIVNHLPVLSLAGARLQPMENAAPLYKEAARRTLKLLGTAQTGAAAPLQDALTTLLLHRDGNLADCEALLADMLQWRDQWGRLVPLDEDLSDTRLDREIKPKLERALQHSICQVLSKVESLFPSDELHELVKLTVGAARVIEEQQKPSKIRTWLGRTHAPGSTHDDLEAWRALAHQLLTTTDEWRSPKGINIKLGFVAKSREAAAKKELLTRLAGNEPLRHALAAVMRLPDAEYPAEQWHVAKALFHLLRWSMVELKLLFAETEQCDFAELSLAAQLALGQRSGMHDLEASMGMRVQHLLVDEMQDTSVSQYSLLRDLTSSWDGPSQTVFLVGDPKQSIYLFRQARVELFEQTARHGLGDIQLQRLQLTANFRSQARLVRQFNEDFAMIFPPSPALGEDVAFARADSVRSASSSGIAWHSHLYREETIKVEAGSSRQRWMEQEAAGVMEILRQHHETAAEQQVSPPRIAILVRARNHLRPIASALRKHGKIPFRAVEIEALNEQQEVLDALSLTRALLHPADRVAWLSLLRAPWCGIPLAEMQVLTSRDALETRHSTIAELIDTNLDQLNQDSRMRVERLQQTMRAALEQRHRMPLAQCVERTWHTLGGPACTDAQGRANVDAFLRLLSKCQDETPDIDAGTLQQRMEDLYAAPLVADKHAVELMTIHKAKGLEWDVVIVPGIERRPASHRSNMLEWLELPDFEAARNDSDDDLTFSILVPIQARGESNARLNAWVRGLREQRETAERKRLYYVVCTRAREEVHLFGNIRKNDKGYAPHPSSLLATAWPVAQPHFERKDKEASETTEAPTAQSGTLLTMPSAEAVSDESEFGVIASLAAASDSTGSAPMQSSLRRLPSGFDPVPRQSGIVAGTASFSRTALHPHTTSAQPPSRPQGSLAARALGNATHAFIDKLTSHFSSGGTLQDASPLPSLWKPRIHAFLRGQGLSPRQVETATATTVHALTQILEDPIGQWILSARKEAQSEVAMQGLDLTDGLDPASLLYMRLDRVFRAGLVPLAHSINGEERIWIIDYNTAAHTGTGLAEFLEQEKLVYRPILESYAQLIRMRQGEDAKINLALYFPLMKEFIWWPYEAGATTTQP